MDGEEGTGRRRARQEVLHGGWFGFRRKPRPKDRCSSRGPFQFGLFWRMLSDHSLVPSYSHDKPFEKVDKQIRTYLLGRYPVNANHHPIVAVSSVGVLDNGQECMTRPPLSLSLCLFIWCEQHPLNGRADFYEAAFPYQSKRIQ